MHTCVRRLPPPRRFLFARWSFFGAALSVVRRVAAGLQFVAHPPLEDNDRRMKEAAFVFSAILMLGNRRLLTERM